MGTIRMKFWRSEDKLSKSTWALQEARWSLVFNMATKRNIQLGHFLLHSELYKWIDNSNNNCNADLLSPLRETCMSYFRKLLFVFKILEMWNNCYALLLLLLLLFLLCLWSLGFEWKSLIYAFKGRKVFKPIFGGGNVIHLLDKSATLPSSTYGWN